MERLGLYVHIPFCVKKCDYCDFLSYGGVAQRTKDMYIECLCHELTELGELFHGRTLSTVYIGGGTPSVLSEHNFNKLMEKIQQAFALGEHAEITMEMNPGTVTEDKLKAYVAAGINRVSMGLQSDDDQQLKDLGRIHTYQDYVDTYHMVRRAGINNINIDVMFGLHNQTMAQWQDTLDQVIKLQPEHISAYSLIIEEETPFEDRLEAGLLNLPDEETERQMFWYAHERLEEAGYGHYEISNYAKKGMASQHNSAYWDLTPYIGAGLGASSYYDQRRYKNVTSMDAYLREAGKVARIRLLEQSCDAQSNVEESFFLGLRRLEGLDVEKLIDEYGEDFMAPYMAIAEEQVAKGLLEKVAGRIRLTKRGVDISNQVMSAFLI